MRCNLKILNQTRLLANLMTKGVSKSLTRSGRPASLATRGGRLVLLAAVGSPGRLP